MTLENESVCLLSVYLSVNMCKVKNLQVLISRLPFVRPQSNSRRHRHIPIAGSLPKYTHIAIFLPAIGNKLKGGMPQLK